jgi:3-oxoacyl-[acyl-carrier-protein] synthase-3
VARLEPSVSRGEDIVPDLFIDSVSYYYDGLEPAIAAVAHGRYSEAERLRSRQESVAVSPPDRFQADLAGTAARACLAESPIDPDSIALALHCVAFDSGVPLWSSASYVSREAGIRPQFSAELNAASNGLVAVELAGTYLRSLPTGRSALITTADAWRQPSIDRWRTDKGLVFGDVGTAAVLSNEAGSFRVRALCTQSDPRWEGLHRGDARSTGPGAAPAPVDLALRARQFLGDGQDRDAFFAANRGNLRSAFHRALDVAAVSRAEVDWFVLPFFGNGLLTAQCIEPLAIDPARTTASFGLRIGHTGAGDQIAGLRSLQEQGRLADGALVALVGVGAGFTWSVAIVEYRGSSVRPGARR